VSLASLSGCLKAVYIVAMSLFVQIITHIPLSAESVVSVRNLEWLLIAPFLTQHVAVVLL